MLHDTLQISQHFRVTPLRGVTLGRCSAPHVTNRYDEATLDQILYRSHASAWEQVGGAPAPRISVLYANPTRRAAGAARAAFPTLERGNDK